MTRCCSIGPCWNPIPARTHYILMTIQNIVFALDVVLETVLPNLLQNGFSLCDFRKAKHYHQKSYNLSPLAPTHSPAEKRSIHISLGKRYLSISMAKNPFEMPCRYKKKNAEHPGHDMGSETSDT
ncbi:hypothetical protein NPIL_91351 [Nephila pilipes]|uniref:Uncharacterized protein n=1 Tax=Nephila pilipes TaxID=299642 RepID=A0A8X6NV11_NEPPI|nr:hypothetical protein NPIL_91351 [Nephila pilipes]